VFVKSHPEPLLDLTLNKTIGIRIRDSALIGQIPLAAFFDHLITIGHAHRRLATDAPKGFSKFQPGFLPERR